MKNNNKILLVGDVRTITDQWLRNEISYSKMVELLNEIIDKKAILKEELELQTFKLEWNINYELNSFFVDRDYEAAKLRIATLFFYHKNDVFKKRKTNE
jgi:hypothetical protein